MNTFADTFILANAKYFAADKIPFIKERLESLPKEKEVLLSALELKDPFMMLIISWFAGPLGLDRFLIGDTTVGILKLVTLGGCGIWAFVDLFLIMNATKEANFNKLMQVL